MKKIGYDVLPYSDSTLENLSKVAQLKKEQLISDFDCWSQWIEPLDPTKSYENEITLLKLALEKNGFAADEEFIKQISKDDIVEFYNEDMIQLFRSFNFYKITGYSILDISTLEWFKLWERSQQVLEGLGGELMATLAEYIPVKSFDTKAYTVREIYNSSNSAAFKPRASLLTPVKLGSLKPLTTSIHRKKGFICTSKGEVLAVGDGAKNIQYI
ncbi:MAG: hypothetical protein KA715_07580 [Xanthomonadaceae bacterium]|nr:hypothetical protein [Xanthomonadaceae bacterium]